ncbi:MAG TPA: type II secretion system protein, partial [Candidatus Dojkabacteria bacterium]|nr:type II secretion system protein [Candidatus Dojkabacteria bacterium]
MNKKYSGFVLVEMLIVMGIIIILTVVGITAGRFAINRANDVAHRNAVDQVYTSLQAYYTDKRAYPIDSVEDSACAGTICSLKELVGDQDTVGYLVPYIDANSFDGG